MNPEELRKLNAFVRQKTKIELTKLCQEKNLPIKGTKHDLAVRLLGVQVNTRVSVEPFKRPVICIRKNQWGRYVHLCSNLVFDKLSRKVVGKEDGNGGVLRLKRADIQICQQYKFQYSLPEILDDPDHPLGKKILTRDAESSDEEDGDDTFGGNEEI